jgi:hypothetical protein
LLLLPTLLSQTVSPKLQTLCKAKSHISFFLKLTEKNVYVYNSSLKVQLFKAAIHPREAFPIIPSILNLILWPSSAKHFGHILSNSGKPYKS